MIWTKYGIKRQKMERNEDGKLELVRPDNSFTDEAGLSGCEVNQ